MKTNTLIILAAAALFIAASGVAMAEEPMDAKDSMKHHEGMKKDMGYDMYKMMKMKAMTDKKMIATQDGGVVVLIGNKLIKYDKNLEVVKEAEIQIDTEAMMKRCKEMKEKCGMMKEPSASE